MRPGALVRFDVGCTYKGYCSSVARTAVLGEPAPRFEAAYRAVQAGLEEAIAAVATGASAGHALDAAVEGVRATGRPKYAWDQAGHGIGLDRREPPALTPDGGTLESGEVLCIETPYFEIGGFGMSARDTLLVTSAGGRSLNRSHHGLVVLD